MERPTRGPESWTRIVDPNCGPDLFTRLVHSTCGALKKKELFRIGLVNRPRVGDVRLVDRPCVEPYKRGVDPDWTCVEP